MILPIPSTIGRPFSRPVGPASCLPVPVASRLSAFQTSNPSRKSYIVNRKSGAFTLIEIMIAMGIFAMLVAALFATWTLVIRATLVGKRTAAQLQRERVAMHTMEDALTCIQSHQASINYYLFIVQNGSQPYLSFTADLPQSFPRSGEFLSDTPDGTAMDYYLRRVTFSLQPAQNGEKDLVLQQNQILMDVPDAEKRLPLVLAHNVSDFLIECWDTNAMQWDTAWDSTNMIPPLLRVTIAFGNQNSGGAQVITRVICFPSGTMPASVQSPGYNNSLGGGYQNYQNNNQGNSAGAPGGPGFNPFGPQSKSMSVGNGPVNVGPPVLPNTSTQLR